MTRLLLPLLLAGTATALPSAVDAPDAPTTQLGPGLVHPALPLPLDALDALASRDHATAAAALATVDTRELRGDQVGDHAFLLAWSLIRADRAGDAVHLADAVRGAEHVPAAYLQLTVGELLLAQGEAVAAAEALAWVDDSSAIWPRAALVRAEALHTAGRTADARAVYRDLAERPDPAEGSALALWALAQGAGLGSEEARAHLVRLWTDYPRHTEGLRAATALAEHGGLPGWRQVGARGDALMRAGRHRQVIGLLSARLDQVEDADPDACRYWFALGRSYYRVNHLTDAGKVLEPAGRACPGLDDDRGAKSLYLAGKARERKKDWAGAARIYALLPELYPDHSMADDGYALAGIALQEAGDPAGARALWSDQVERYPTGDMAGEGFWRLAWGSYLDADPTSAIRWAERMLDEVPLEVDPTRVRAAAYWSARWRAWPYVDAPTLLNSDPAEIAAAAEGLLDVLRRSPWTYYAAQAAARLEELAPEVAATVPLPAADTVDEPWVVRTAFLADPAVSAGISLHRLGLHGEAMAELAQLGDSNLSPTELAFVIQLQEQVDPVGAHDRFRRYLVHHPAETITLQREQVMRVAWPLRWWSEVEDATQGYAWDPRLFHALVREESNFNPRIVSHAGAKGLSQLMTPTARSVGRSMGIQVTTAALYDPETNLRIGARYLDSLIEKSFDGNLCLALAGYNAGPGNVRSWLSDKGNLPTDAWVESIPFRETRHYVKRVMDSFLTYRVLYAPETRWPDLSDFNHAVRPEG